MGLCMGYPAWVYTVFRWYHSSNKEADTAPFFDLETHFCICFWLSCSCSQLLQRSIEMLRGHSQRFVRFEGFRGDLLRESLPTINNSRFRMHVFLSEWVWIVACSLVPSIQYIVIWVLETPSIEVTDFKPPRENARPMQIWVLSYTRVI